MNRLYEWLHLATERFMEKADRGTRRVVRTEVTVQQERRTILVGGTLPDAFRTCPFCGHKMAPTQAAQPGNRLADGSSTAAGSSGGHGLP